MKVKIIKASSPYFWYADRIGQTYIVKESEEREDDYQRIHDGGDYIAKDDCVLMGGDRS